ncbi:MAG TPA: serine hydrolase domain-containing protein [Steroidobacter sp.]
MMRRTRQTPSLLTLLLAALAAFSPPGRADDLSPTAAAIDQVARAAIAAGEVPGLQIAIYKDGVPLLVKGYGLANLELNVPVNDDTVFRIGSITKQFTAAALLLLQEEGKLSLDDKLAKYYPGFPGAADISLKQMLHHTSGLRNYTAEESFRRLDQKQMMPTDQWVEYFARMPKTQDFEPGTAYSYSNTGYFLLGAVIEKVEGKPLAAVFRDRFFVPLGMAHTALDDEKDIVPGRAAGYDNDAQGKFRNADFISLSAVGAAGAIRSTASDLVRWNNALFGGKVLTPASFQAMITPGKLNDGRTSSSVKKSELDGEYGLGLVLTSLEGRRCIRHHGAIRGFSSVLQQFPEERLTIALLFNSLDEDKRAFEVAERIRRVAIGVAP